MVIAASFLFFCSTGLFFGAAAWRGRFVVALAGLLSIALATLLYLESSGAVGSLYDRIGEFFLPYLFFVVSAFFFAGRFWKRPIANAVAGSSAIVLGILVYPQMYQSMEWIHQKSEGGISAIAHAIFGEARAVLGWLLSAGSSHAPAFHDETVLNFVVASTMVLFFLLSGLASRLFVLSKAEPSTDRLLAPARPSAAAGLVTRSGPTEK